MAFEEARKALQRAHHVHHMTVSELDRVKALLREAGDWRDDGDDVVSAVSRLQRERTKALMAKNEARRLLNRSTKALRQLRHAVERRHDSHAAPVSPKKRRRRAPPSEEVVVTSSPDTLKQGGGGSGHSPRSSPRRSFVQTLAVQLRQRREEGVVVPTAAKPSPRTSVPLPSPKQTSPSKRKRKPTVVATDGADTGYAYVEVVRGRDARHNLTAKSCPDCDALFALLDGDQGSQSLVQKCGRHRHRHHAPDTPEGFWDLGFPD